MNLQQLREYTRNFVQDRGTSVITDPTVDTELNRAARILAETYGLTRKRNASLTVAANTYSVTLPADFAGVGEDLVRWNGAELPCISADQAYVSDVEAFTGAALKGAPQGYLYEPFTDYGNALMLWPTPNVAGTLDFTYQQGATMSARTDQPWGGRHADYHDAIALKAAILLCPHFGPSGSGMAAQIAPLFAAREADLSRHAAAQRLPQRRRLKSTLTLGGKYARS